MGAGRKMEMKWQLLRNLRKAVEVLSEEGNWWVVVVVVRDGVGVGVDGGGEDLRWWKM